MPSFREQAQTLADWRRFPARELLDPAAGRLALSFDDGPDPDATPAVLDALDAAGAVATFFLVGEQAERHPNLAREVAARGHAVGLHCHRHQRSVWPGPGAAADLRRGLEAVERAAGERPLLVRPPYGRFTDAAYTACRELRLDPVYWSAWGLDWETVDPVRIADLAGRDLQPGAIVLLHDSARYAPRPSAAPTAQALPELVARARETGLEPDLL